MLQVNEHRKLQTAAIKKNSTNFSFKVLQLNSYFCPTFFFCFLIYILLFNIWGPSCFYFLHSCAGQPACLNAWFLELVGVARMSSAVYCLLCAWRACLLSQPTVRTTHVMFDWRTQWTPSQSIFSSRHRCPNVFSKLMPVLCHSACCCHRTKRICDVFLPSRSQVAFLWALHFAATNPCITVSCKPLCLVTWPTYFSVWRLTKLRRQFVCRWN